MKYRESATRATPLNWTMIAWSSSSTSTTKENRIYQFFRERFNQRRLQFQFAYSFSNYWLEVSRFSLQKALVKCPSLSVNGIFDNVRYDVISTWRYCSVELNFLMLKLKYSPGHSLKFSIVIRPCFVSASYMTTKPTSTFWYQLILCIRLLAAATL